MSFSPQMLRSRLAGSTEAADSITSTAHWILFHKRHAPAIAEEWASAVTAEQNKLPQIYIANEVIQQSKIKRKAEFVDAFSAVLPRTLASAYESSDLPTRDRIMRVIRVWRDRAIFTPDAQKSIEDAVRNAGESMSAPAAPEDLRTLVKLYSSFLGGLNSGNANKLAEDVIAELDNLKARVNEIKSASRETIQSEPSPETAGLTSPEVEPLPQSQAPKVEVYTAQQARASVEAAAGDEEDLGYADSEDDAPQEKKPKVETGVDPKLASFLASISSNH